MVARPASRHRLRVIAQENTYCVFLLRDLPLEIRDLRVCGVQSLLRLEHIELRRHAVLNAQRGELNRILLGRDRLVRDLQLQIKFQQREVVARNIAQRNCQAAECFRD